MERRVLFLDSVHPILEEQLTEHGLKCEHDYSCSAPELIEKIAPYEGLVLRSRLRIDESILKAASNLKFIARSGSGLENIEVNKAKELGIAVVNSPEGNCEAVGEHTLGLLLSVLNHLCHGNREVSEGIWDREKNRGKEIGHMTIGIIGFGHTGQAFARKLSGFGCRILYHDTSPIDHNLDYAESVELEEIFKSVDVVSLHIPYNSNNHYYADQTFFESFEKAFYFLNTSRGKVLETDALVAGLNNRSVLGAGIDVLEYEHSSFEMDGSNLPGAFKSLVDHPEVILSPHVAGWTVESYKKLSQFLFDKLRAQGLV